MNDMGPWQSLAFACCVVVAALAVIFVPPLLLAFFERRRNERETAQMRDELIVEGMKYGIEYVPGESLSDFREVIIHAREQAEVAAEKKGRRA